jgi:hypothetical protein
MTEETNQAAAADEAQNPQPTQPPDATIGITWNGASGFSIAIQRNSDLNQPAAHLADWLHRNLQALSMMAAVDWNLKQEHHEQVRQILQAAAGHGDQAAEDAEEKEPKLQLVSPSGGLVQ